MASFGIRMFLDAFENELNILTGMNVRFVSRSATEIDKDCQEFHKQFISTDSKLFSNCSDVTAGALVRSRRMCWLFHSLRGTPGGRVLKVSWKPFLGPPECLNAEDVCQTLLGPTIRIMIVS